MALIVGSFQTQEGAEQALARLLESGIQPEEAVMVANARGSDLEGPRGPDDALAARNAAAAAEPTAAAAAAGAAADADGAPEAISDDSPEINTTEKESEGTVNSAALGAAVGLFVGGGIFGPLGLALGAVAGTGMGLASALAARGLSSNEAQRSETDVLAGRYLVAVETDRQPAEEIRARLQDAGVDQVQVQA